MKKVQDCMTSELLFEALKSDSDKSIYICEYERRLKLMGLTDEQIVKFRESDEISIENGCYIKSNVLLAESPFIYADMNPVDLKKCTFSELVYLTDSANFAHDNNRYSFPEKVLRIICQNTIYSGVSNSDSELRARMKSIGISKKQIDFFIFNECQIANRLQWHYSQKMAW